MVSVFGARIGKFCATKPAPRNSPRASSSIMTTRRLADLHATTSACSTIALHFVRLQLAQCQHYIDTSSVVKQLKRNGDGVEIEKMPHLGMQAGGPMEN